MSSALILPDHSEKQIRNYKEDSSEQFIQRTLLEQPVPPPVSFLGHSLDQQHAAADKLPTGV